MVDVPGSVLSPAVVVITSYSIHYTKLYDNVAAPTGKLVHDNREIVVETGNFLESAADVRQLVVGVAQRSPVYLSAVADLEGEQHRQHHDAAAGGGRHADEEPRRGGGRPAAGRGDVVV